jgi:hypothetical protein
MDTVISRVADAGTDSRSHAAAQQRIKSLLLMQKAIEARLRPRRSHARRGQSHLIDHLLL